MNKNSIKANDGGVVVTGKVKGNITTNVKEEKSTSDEVTENSKSKIPIIAAVITALGAIVSGLLIAASTFFGV